MTDEKENRKYYQETFKEAHASSELLRKIEAMGMENNKKKERTVLRKGCIVAIALAAALISSNIISYAATGSPWIITVTTRDGSEVMQEMEQRTVDGITFYTSFVGEDEILVTDLLDTCLGAGRGPFIFGYKW